jgi:hypothetical protein
MTLIDKVRYCLDNRKKLKAGDIVIIRGLYRYYVKVGNYDDLPRRDTDAAESIYKRLTEKP